MGQNNSGQSIIEVIIAVGIVALVLVALVTAVTVSIKNSTFSKNKSIANKYINEGIEAVRSIRDTSWTTLYSESGQVNGLLSSAGVWNFSGASDIPATGFTRTVDVSCPNNQTCNITVTVTWISGGQNHSSSASTVFTKWSN
ncbi:hypothetical protein HYT02_03460 [Candidatus Gottesmanbacteria bacterium]|nr:hypothetical protein [Candidatus Gottesmanbacteria bacterium]